MDSDSASGSTPGPKKPSTLRKILFWGVCLAVLMLAGFEVLAQQGYQKSATLLQQRMSATQKTQSSKMENVLLKRAALEGVPQGFYFLSSDRRKTNEIISWKWPSLLQRYVIEVRINDQDEVLEVAMDRAIDRQPTGAIVPNIKVDSVSEKTLSLELLSQPQNILAREVIRQAFMETAREQFGLATPDSVFRETAERGGDHKNWPFELDLSVRDDGEVQVAIWLTAPENREKVFSEQIRIQPAQHMEVLPEIAARWKQEIFPEILRKAGYQRLPKKAESQPATPVTDEVVRLQSNLDPISQFAALRVLHAQLDSEAPSAPVCTALARGYALLGSLTELNWGVMHKVFKARALLWAEHAVKTWPENPEVLWSRAYVRSLCGLPVLALADMERGTTINAEAKPEWGDPLKAYCSWDLSALERHGGKDWNLARYLQFLLLEQLGLVVKIEHLGQEIWPEHSECWRIGASLATKSSLGVRHATAANGLASLAQTTPALLKQISDLPTVVRSQLPSSDQPPGQVNRSRLLNEVGWDDSSQLHMSIIRELLKADDESGRRPSSLSWRVLGVMLDEFQFQQVISSLDFQRFHLSVNTSEAIKRVNPLLNYHPLARLVECYDNDITAVKKVCAEITPMLRNMEFGHGAEISRELAQAYPELDFIYRIAQRGRDFVAPELIMGINDINGSNAVVDLNVLTVISPDCPIVAGMSIKIKWKKIEHQASQLEEKFADNPQVMQRFSEQYYQLDRMEDARRTAAQWVKINPEFGNCWLLAVICQKLGDWEGEQQALMKILTLPTFGLESAQASANLAYGFMNHQEWGKANEYANRAAGSYSAWGLIVGAECNEGLQKWKEAEELVCACSLRYEDSAKEWYFWCRRTGYGDSDAALQVFEKHLSQTAREDSHETLLQKAVVQQLENNKDLSCELIFDYAKRTKSHYGKMLAAIFASKAGKIADRDQLLQELAQGGGVSSAACVADAVLHHHGKERITPTDKQLEWYAFQDLRSGEPSNGMYFVAQGLKMMDDPRWIDWLRRCASSPSRDQLSVILAGQELTSLGHESPLRRGSELNDEFVDALRIARAGLEFRKSHYERCFNKLQSAISLAPDFLSLQYALAESAFKYRRYEEAVESYSEIISQEPLIVEAYVGLGRTHEAMGLPELALEDYEAGLKILPDHKTLHNNVAWLLLGAIDDRIRDIPRGLEHGLLALGRGEQHQADELSLRAAMAAAQGQSKEAVALQEQALPFADSNFLLSLTQRRDVYKKGLSYRQSPLRMPLINLLPSDGAWASYDLHINRGFKRELEETGHIPSNRSREHLGKITLRSVGTLVDQGKSLRCLEIELDTQNPLVPFSIYRLIVLESEFGLYRNPWDSVVKLWAGSRNGPILPFKQLADDPFLQFCLQGATHDISQKSNQPLELINRSLECEIFSGMSDFLLFSENEQAFWTIYRCDEIPFGMTKSIVTMDGEALHSATLTLTDYGTGAKAAFPHLVP